MTIERAKKLSTVLSVALLGVMLLTSCSANSEPKSIKNAPIIYVVPSSCSDTEILAAFPKSIKNPKWIDTQWQPASGTDLAAVYQKGGIACSYGLASAAIGNTVSWAPKATDLYSKRIPTWVAAGYEKVEIPGVETQKAYLLSDAARNKMEIPSWSINILTKDTWISIGSTYLKDLGEATPLINAAIASLRVSTATRNISLVGCYLGQLAKDIFTIDVTSQDNNLILANINYLPAEKDSSVGKFVGSYTNNILDGTYTFESEGITSIRELIFKGDKNGLVAGYSAYDSIGDGARYLRPLDITWETAFTFLPSAECIQK